MSRCANNRAGFTLVELLTASAVALLLMALLVGFSGQMSRAQLHGLNRAQRNNRQRVALNFMARELRQAVLSRDTAAGSSANRLQFVINPAGLENYAGRDSIFWQAPVATNVQAGDLAVVGYFVAWQGNQPNLRRLFVNPNSPDYKIYGGGRWITAELANNFSSADNDAGLFLENVAGLWVAAYATGAAGETPLTVWDSSANHKLPARVDISLLVLDAVAAKRLSAPVAAGDFATAEECLAALPAPVRAGASVVSFSVVLDNYQ